MLSRSRPFAVVLLATGVLATACGGGGGGSDDGVATLSDSESSGDNAQGSQGSDTASDEEVLDYVECLRDQGLDVADPTVDADGNLVLGGGPGGPGRPPGDGDDSTSDDAATEQPTFDREEFEAAREECGDPPRSAVGGFSEEDQQALQDASLAFAECMRGEGIDFPDPDFSDIGPGGPPGRANGANGDDSADSDQPRGPFGSSIDMDDPEVQAAFEACQDELGDLPGRGGAGAPGQGDAPSQQGADGSST